MFHPQGWMDTEYAVSMATHVDTGGMRKVSRPGFRSGPVAPHCPPTILATSACETTAQRTRGLEGVGTCDRGCPERFRDRCPARTWRRNGRQPGRARMRVARWKCGVRLIGPPFAGGAARDWRPADLFLPIPDSKSSGGSVRVPRSTGFHGLPSVEDPQPTGAGTRVANTRRGGLLAPPSSSSAARFSAEACSWSPVTAARRSRCPYGRVNAIRPVGCCTRTYCFPSCTNPDIP